MTSVVIDSNELLGKTLGSCRLERLIGRGGMGAVYLAQQSRPRRAVAIKVLMPGAALLEGEQRSEFLRRFRREADAIAALDHVNIMPLYEYGEEGQFAYLVMPYVTGGTLRDILDKQGKLSLDEALPVVEQAAAALSYAHDRGIIHRDLKPGNILFHSDGRVLLADFGLAKMIKGSNELQPETETLTVLTTAGMVIGTPEYLSPEQANAAPVDQRTDIYSLGIVLYQMLSGRLPFLGATPVAIAIKHMMEMPPSLSELNPAIPPRVEAVILKAIAKDPEARYARVDELAKAFREAINEIYVSKNRAALQARPVIPQPVLSPEQAIQQEVRPAAPMLPEQAQPVLEKVLQPGAALPPEQPQEPQVKHSEKSEQPASTPEPELVAVSLSNEATTEMPRPNEAIEKPRIRTFPTTPDHSPLPEGGGKRPRLKLLLPLVLLIILATSLTMLVIHNSNTAVKTQAQTKAKATATHPPIQTQLTPEPTSTATAPATPPALHLPAPAISAGTLLYGTSKPGSCDVYGGTWSTVGDNQVSCSADGTLLTSNNDMTRQIGGIFLDKLPNGQPLPSDYIVQFQAQIKSGEGFGIFGEVNGSHDTGMLIRALADGSVDGYSYNSARGGSQIFTAGGSQALSGTVTITVQVQGSSSMMTLYVNGSRNGYGSSSNLGQGSMGIGTSNGSQLLIKNLAIYAMP